MTLSGTNNAILKKNKISINKLCFILLLVFAWIMFALNYSNADFANYENAYNAIGEGKEDSYFEVGFFILIKIFTFFNLPYQVFLAFVALLCLTLFTMVIRRLTSRYSLAFLLYIIYPFAFDIVQYRNMLSFSFVLLGICCLISNKSSAKIRALKYLVFVLIGSLFHSSAIIYSLFVLVTVKKEKIFYALLIMLLVLVMLFSLKVELFVPILKAVKLDRYARYEYDRNISTFLQYFAFYVFLLILAAWKFDKKRNSVKFRLLLVSSAFVPFIIMNGTSARLIRNVLILFYCFLFDKLKKEETLNDMKQGTIVVFTFAAVMFVFYSQLASGLYYDLVLRPVFEYNYLIGKL